MLKEIAKIIFVAMVTMLLMAGTLLLGYVLGSSPDSLHIKLNQNTTVGVPLHARGNP